MTTSTACPSSFMASGPPIKKAQEMSDLPGFCPSVSTRLCRCRPALSDQTCRRRQRNPRARPTICLAPRSSSGRRAKMSPRSLDTGAKAAASHAVHAQRRELLRRTVLTDGRCGLGLSTVLTRHVLSIGLRLVRVDRIVGAPPLPPGTPGRGRQPRVDPWAAVVAARPRDAPHGAARLDAASRAGAARRRAARTARRGARAWRRAARAPRCVCDMRRAASASGSPLAAAAARIAIPNADSLCAGRRTARPSASARSWLQRALRVAPPVRLTSPVDGRAEPLAAPRSTAARRARRPA